MVVQVHGFDWEVYEKRVMPAFARWLIENHEIDVSRLFEQTRCALEERFLPAPMQQLRVWPRASTFVNSLPRGPHSRKEYSKLCNVAQFTALGDRYLHNHAPHLYQDSSALRTVWGAIIEKYCLPWIQPASEALNAEHFATASEAEADESEQTDRGELVSLLFAAGLADLAQEVSEQSTAIEHSDWEAVGTVGAAGSAGSAGSVGTAMNEGIVETGETDDDHPGGSGRKNVRAPLVGAHGSEDTDEGEANETDFYADEEQGDVTRPRGILIGQHPNTLHLRGWLAATSVRAMALFEYLACGRRRMPFGCETGEPFGAYCGYLTPHEVWQLATSLRGVQPPDQSLAEEAYQRFCQQQTAESQDMYLLVDEVLPTYALEFLQAVRRAAIQGLGLICSIE